MDHGALQVIPDDLRSSAYAFDKGITGLLGALAAPLVGASPLACPYPHGPSHLLGSASSHEHVPRACG